MSRSLILWLWCVFLVNSLNAQDPIFSQISKTRIFTNPAVTGLSGGLTLTGVMREQWGSINGPMPLWGTFRTQAGAIEYTSASDRNAVGLFFMNDIEGDANLQTDYGGLNYCYVIPWDQWHGTHNFRLGFGLYYARKSIQWDQLLFSDQLHPKGEEYFLPSSNHAQYFDAFEENPPFWTGLNIGGLYRYSEKNSLGNGKQISVGLGASHVLDLLSPTSYESLQSAGTNLDWRFSLTSSAIFPLLKFGPKGNRFTPIFNAQIDYQGGVSAFTLGNDLLYKNVGLGLYYRNTLANTFSSSTDALIFAFTMEVFFSESQSVELGLSYDVNINGLGAYTGGVFELVAKYRIGKLSNSIVCPDLWRVNRDWEKNTLHKNPKNKNLN